MGDTGIIALCVAAMISLGMLIHWGINIVVRRGSLGPANSPQSTISVDQNPRLFWFFVWSWRVVSVIWCAGGVVVAVGWIFWR
jgi:hypothetical protein